MALTTLFLAAASPTSSAAPPHTGIRGQAFLYISYGAPVEVAPGIWVGVPSVQFPIAASFRILSAHNGREIGRVVTDVNGLYSVRLPPGKYILAPEPMRVNPFLPCEASTEPIEVRVQAKNLSFRNIFYFREGPCAVLGTPDQAGN